jgi:hypothetical protein
MRYVETVRCATILATVLSFLMAAGVFKDRFWQCSVGLFGGFLGVFATTMGAFRAAENLNVKVVFFASYMSCGICLY